MISVENGTPMPAGFMVLLPRSAMLTCADVLGRVSGRALRSASGVVSLMDIFNCLVTLRGALNPESYITNERGECLAWVTSWDTARVAAFLDLTVQGEISGLTANQSEIESLRIISSRLRNNHEQYN